jgi:hypothetical protein
MERLNRRARFAVLCLTLCARSADAGFDMEQLFGPTAIRAATGHGGLTAGISAHGELTVLRWPNPTYSDQLHFSTPVGLKDARSLPRLGAAATDGGFWGIQRVRPDGARVGSWLRGDLVNAGVQFQGGDTTAIRYAAQHSLAGVTLRCDVAVEHEPEMLRWRCEPEVNDAAKGERLRVAFYLRTALQLARPQFDVKREVDADASAGFALACGGDGCAGFVPKSKDAAALALRDGWQKSPPSTLAQAWAAVPVKDSDVVLGVMADPSPAVAETDVQTASGGPYHRLGQPAAAKFAFGPAALRIEWDVAVESPGALQVALAFGSPVSAPSRASPVPFDAAKAERAWIAKAWTAGLAKADVDRIRRALLTIRTARDKTSGAIVASIASQPPYHVDWPRDGAFIDRLLDIAGYHDEVTQHLLFYAKCQRKKDEQDVATPGLNPVVPAGSFAQAYDADCRPGGIVDFEIDQVGLFLWDAVDHVRWLNGTKRNAYVDAILPAVVAAADAAMRCRDDKSGLLCPAQEDDNLELTQGNQGATTVLLGLRAAISLLEVEKLHADKRKAYEARANELEGAIRKHFFPDDGGKPQVAEEWTVWPLMLWPRGAQDAGALAAVRDRLLQALDQNLVRREGGETLYEAKRTLALLWSLPVGDARRQTLDAAVKVLLEDVPTDDTGLYGEVYLPVTDSSGKANWLNRTAIPHVWEGTLAALTVYARKYPELLDHTGDARHPAVRPKPAEAVADDSCRSGHRAASWAAAGVLALAAAAIVRRRKWVT